MPPLAAAGGSDSRDTANQNGLGWLRANTPCKSPSARSRRRHHHLLIATRCYHRRQLLGAPWPPCNSGCLSLPRSVRHWLCAGEGYL